MTVEEILRQTGLTDEQIKALDSSVVTGFTTVLNTAETARADAQEAERRYKHMYETEIVPALNNWGSEKATIAAERDFYKAQNEGARTAGFIPKDVPGFQPGTPPPTSPRGADGRYVAEGNPVPGSPALQMREVMTGISNAQWAMNEHLRLYGTPLPDDFEQLLEQSSGKMMPFRQYVTEKYKFEEKKKEISEKKAKEHDDAIRKDERQKIEKENAERGGQNPNLRPAAASHYASVRKAVQSGTVKDPVKMNAEERRRQTRDMIAQDVAEHQSQGNA